jgi:hypothetical protein
MAFALMPSALLRALIALSFAVPAAMAGYEAAFGLIQLSVASHPVQRVWRAPHWRDGVRAHDGPLPARLG